MSFWTENVSYFWKIKHKTNETLLLLYSPDLAWIKFDQSCGLSFDLDAFISVISAWLTCICRTILRNLPLKSARKEVSHETVHKMFIFKSVFVFET